MKRALFVILFLLVTATLVACGQQAGPAGGWDQQVKIPAAESHPEVLQAMEQVWQPTATAAAATATASEWATMIAPPEPTPTLVPSATPEYIYTIQPGNTMGGIFEYIFGHGLPPGSKCTIYSFSEFNGITDINVIQAGAQLRIPPGCPTPVNPPN